MKVKLKLAESLTSSQVKEVMKPFNNQVIEVETSGAVAKKLNRDYIAMRTEQTEDGYSIWAIHHITDIPEF